MELPPLKIGHLVSKLPIIQGGMGVGISLSGLASAVANEGGIGVIATIMIGINEPCITTDGAQAQIGALKREIRKAKDLTQGILGVNIMVASTDFGDTVRTAIQEGIDIIFSGAGLPLNLPGYLRDGDQTKLVPIVSSRRAANILCKKWLSRFSYLPDAFVVEGPMAGGHLGFRTEQLDDPDFALEHLIKDVIEAVEPFERSEKKTIPVIAAGGIYSGEDIYNALQIGSAGVQMGTRFVATHECDADKAFKEMYVKAKAEDLMIIKSPVGLPGRVIRNEFIERINNGEKRPLKCPYHCIKTCDLEKSPYCIALALECARRGKFKNGFAFAGQNAYRVNEIVSVKELINSLKAEYSLTMHNSIASKSLIRHF
ncbi:MAG: nitronate monooxygenase family protein [Desulfobacterales bacterium]|jgi:nitronate monooxygenase